MSVLSIQSHVVYGYAGNTAAVFPLQRLGNEVWAVNTVEFSNHTGYGSWRGKILGADLVQDLVAGLEERKVLNQCNAVLSGYLGDAQVGKAVLEAVYKVKKENPKALYCCDPVMGDTGRGFYVKDDIPAIFKNDLIPNADIICPNQFELEAITGIKINNSIDKAAEALNCLHKMGPSVILVTSFMIQADTISMLASVKSGQSSGLYKLTTPYLPLGNNVAGTGDLTTSVFLSRFLEFKKIGETNPAAAALALCASSVYNILDKSFRLCNNKNMRAAPCELKLINSQEELCSPSTLFEAVKIEL